MKRVSLIQSPTPLHRLEHLSEELGLDLWIKRDDLTGFALGGNKGRKLEYLMADVLASGADTVVTCGSCQSNFIRQLAAACAVFKIRAVAAVMHHPCEFDPVAGAVAQESGNLLLDRWLGADLRILPDGTWDTLFEATEELALTLEREGRKVYRIPVGGSSALGAFAFWEAAKELTERFDSVVFSTSSGSTQTGLAHFFRNSGTEVLGIAADPEPDLADQFVELSAGLAELLGEEPLAASDYRINFDFVGPGYGVPSEAGNAAIERLARREGIFLDPIYSGKAFAGLLELVAHGHLSGRVLFWHTGGIPSLFATAGVSPSSS